MTDAADYRKRCRDIAGFLEWRGYSGAVVTIAVSIFSMATLNSAGAYLTAFMIGLLAIHGASVAVVLALSLLLYFDAHLFRRMAKYPDEISGGAALDTYLARKRLKQRPAIVRPLADRIAGARRWAERQLIAASLAVASALLALALHFA